MRIDETMSSQDSPLTTAQRLGVLIKFTHASIHEDKGLNGDRDRVPRRTWIMFLKFLGDLDAPLLSVLDKAFNFNGEL
jgi:hypothetical protein